MESYLNICNFMLILFRDFVSWNVILYYSKIMILNYIVILYHYLKYFNTEFDPRVYILLKQSHNYIC